jgi:hypothetical protein
MNDYDVKIHFDLWTWHTCLMAANRAEASRVLRLRLQEENIPLWFITSAEEIEYKVVGTWG